MATQLNKPETGLLVYSLSALANIAPENRLVEALEYLADEVLYPAGDRDYSDVWREQARQVLVAATLHTLHSGEDKSLHGVLALLPDPAVVDVKAQHDLLKPMLRDYYRVYRHTPTVPLYELSWELGGVLATLGAFLEFFLARRLKAHCFLIAASLHTLHSSEDKSLHGVLALIPDPAVADVKAQHELLVTMMSTSHCDDRPHPVVARVAGELLALGKDGEWEVVSCVFSTARDILTRYLNPPPATLDIFRVCEQRLSVGIDVARRRAAKPRPDPKVPLGQLESLLREVSDTLDSSHTARAEYRDLELFDEYLKTGLHVVTLRPAPRQHGDAGNDRINTSYAGPTEQRPEGRCSN